MAAMGLLLALASSVALIASFQCHFSSSALILWPMLPVDALITASIKPAFTASATCGRRVGQRKGGSLDIAQFKTNLASNTDDIVGSSNGGNNENNKSYTTAIIKVAYDGTYFRGWTAGNSESKNHAKVRSQSKSNKQDNGEENKASNDTQAKRTQPQPPKRRQSRRSRTLQRKGFRSGEVRTVADVIKSALAKVYGDVPPDRIAIESCSRTDAGVHAASLVAQFYCSNTGGGGGDPSEDSASPRSLQTRPDSCHDDSNFRPLPFDSDLTKLVFVLNRMLPPDVRIVAASPLPCVPASVPARNGMKPAAHGNGAVFHPTLHTSGKTYAYKFAIGPIHDPLQTQYVWHLDGSSNRAVGMNGKRFCLERATNAANLFVDSADGNAESARPRDYGAFRAAFRGTDKGRVQSTICKLWRCEILRGREETLPSWEAGATGENDATFAGTRNGSRLGEAAIGSIGPGESPQTFTVVISGDRFLYKMIRNIVGTIVAVGCGHMELEDVRVALDTGKWAGNQSNSDDPSKGRGDIPEGTIMTSSCAPKSRTIRRICAPARGLTLKEVYYPDVIDFGWRTG